MHLCLSIHNTCPNKEHNLAVGGAEKQLFRLLPEYESLVENVTLITKYSTYKPKKKSTRIIQAFGKKKGVINRIIHHIFRNKLKIISSLTYAGFISWSLIKTHLKSRIDAINIHILDYMFLPALILANIMGIKTIYKLAGIYKKGTKKTTLNKKSRIGSFFSSFSPIFFEFTINKANIIQAINNEIKNELIYNFKISKEKILLQPNGVNYQNLKNLYDPVQKNIGFVGRLTYIKNIPSIILAFNESIKKHKDWKLFIYGKGPKKEKLVELTEKLNLQNDVVFKGFESNPRKIYGSFSIFIISSFSEGISNSLLEAMAAGIPVIASNVTGNKDVIEDGVSGLLFHPRKQEELEKHINSIIEDEKLREKLRLNAEEKIIQHFDIKVVAKKVLESLSKL